LANASIGIIGGSGLYQMAGLEDAVEVEIETPFGEPSGPYRVGTMEGRRVAFLPRHGKQHGLSPSGINFRANLFGFKKLGVSRILSASAVGSMQEGIAPLDIVIPDQFIDRTRHRPDTFFEDGIVAHVSMADPICPQLLTLSAEAATDVPVRVHRGGIYLCMEGPQFSTRAESELYRTWGVSVIGMTNLQEAKLAREAEICYVTLALVTDYDCWRDGGDVELAGRRRRGRGGDSLAPAPERRSRRRDPGADRGPDAGRARLLVWNGPPGCDPDPSRRNPRGGPPATGADHRSSPCPILTGAESCPLWSLARSPSIR